MEDNMKTYFVTGYYNGDCKVGGWFVANCGTKAMEEFYNIYPNSYCVNVYEERGIELVYLFSSGLF